MTSSCGSRSILKSTVLIFPSLLAVVFLASLSFAQEPDQLPDAPVPQMVAQASEPTPPQGGPPPANGSSITIPAGTHLQLVLTHPLDSHSTSQGDQVFAQTTAPVIVGDQVAIPGGTFVQGKVEKLTRNGTRAEMLMQSAALVFPNGYIAQLGGPVNIESEEWTAWNNPHGGTKAAIILAPILGLGLGTAIGAATDRSHTVTVSAPTPVTPTGPPFPPLPPLPPLTMTETSHKGLVIGTLVGGLGGMTAALVLAGRNHQFYIQEGAPMSMNLPQSITLTQSQVDKANEKASTQPLPVPVRRPYVQSLVSNSDNGTCYFPGSPGTPETHIPGTPGVDGSPGTPDIDIPGTPPSPPIPYPCP